MLSKSNLYGPHRCRYIDGEELLTGFLNTSLDCHVRTHLNGRATTFNTQTNQVNRSTIDKGIALTREMTSVKFHHNANFLSRAIRIRRFQHVIRRRQDFNSNHVLRYPTKRRRSVRCLISGQLQGQIPPVNFRSNNRSPNFTNSRISNLSSRHLIFGVHIRSSSLNRTVNSRFTRRIIRLISRYRTIRISDTQRRQPTAKRQLKLMSMTRNKRRNTISTFHRVFNSPHNRCHINTSKRVLTILFNQASQRSSKADLHLLRFQPNRIIRATITARYDAPLN